MGKPYRPGQVLFSDTILNLIEEGRITPAMTYFDDRTGQTVVVVEAHVEEEEEDGKEVGNA